MSSNETDTRTKILEATWQLMEQRRGQGVRMSDIAKAAGISRQAIYLHFDTRIELMSATTKYVDEIRGLDERLKSVNSAKTSTEALEIYVDVWGNYIPEMYGLAKALLATRETDEAAAAAWDDCMGCLREGCQEIVKVLYAEGKLSPDWKQSEAVEMMWAILSFQNWEQLTVECGWSIAQYTGRVKTLLRQALVVDPKRP